MSHRITSIEHVHRLLALAEGSGRVEFKRSCLWPRQADAIKVQSVLMRLANANPEEGGIIELGREDDGRRVGLVDKDLQPVSARQIAAAEQTLVTIAERLTPPMQIRWQPLHHDGGIQTVVILVPGRSSGHWYQDERGVTITGSASHPMVATPDTLRAWTLEEGHHDRQQRAMIFRRQIGKLRQQAHYMLRMGSAIDTYPHRFDVLPYNHLLPDISTLLPVADPVIERLTDLPMVAGTINRLLDLSQEERKREFGLWNGAEVDPHIPWRMALESQARDLEWQCRVCEERLQEVLGPLSNQLL